MPAHRLTDCLLRFEEFVDVGRREVDRLGNIGKCRFLIAVKAKVFIGSLQDLLPAFVVGWAPLAVPTGFNRRFLLHSSLIISYDYA